MTAMILPDGMVIVGNHAPPRFAHQPRSGKKSDARPRAAEACFPHAMNGAPNNATDFPSRAIARPAQIRRGTLAEGAARPLAPGCSRPGFWLRCDYGVYLMHNANLDAGEKPAVVHALEHNPETMPFSLWLDEKASYGCINEVEFIAAEVIRNAVANDSPLLLHVTAGQYPGRMLIRIV
ncbi:DUF3085 domain-containing protein [Sinorhizobium meliloti]|uniref:DUF3085 domain-containing protein n=1 Tax=Rhizobium meliloti TaxID=382 RepID=UPI001F3BE88D|nr:DUF3085 domain-containing protein [Sinorhizobium meliloti]